MISTSPHQHLFKACFLLLDNPWNDLAGSKASLALYIKKQQESKQSFNRLINLCKNISINEGMQEGAKKKKDCG